MIGAGGLFAESMAETAATETAATTAATTAGTSMFSSLMPAIGIGLMAFNMIGSFSSASKQRKYQQQLAEQQIEQAKLLWQKLKSDNAALYSSVQSSISQKSGAMGAVY